MFFSLTSHLLSLNKPQFTPATQSPFLAQAASGTLSKHLISHWLANDRLYMQGYIRLSGELLRILQLPAKPTPSRSPGTVELRLLDWLVDALVNIRREERFFLDVAERYGINVDLTGEDGVSIEESKKIEGLKRYEKLFGRLTTGEVKDGAIPWLEGVVLFWATEKVYFEAWSWAKREAGELEGKGVEGDQDGGAMRKEFIPNWTNDEFIGFVETLEKILNEGVQQAIERGEVKESDVVKRAERVWEEALEAEVAFWPNV